MSTKRSRNKKAPVIDVELIILANDNPPLADVFLKTLYNAFFQAQVGIMYAKNSETGQVEPLIVGLQAAGDDFNCFPLAKIINSEEAMKYLAPDRLGGWQPLLAPSQTEGVELTAEEMELAKQELDSEQSK